MPESVKFWSKRKKAAFEKRDCAKGPQGIARIGAIFSRKNDISFWRKRDKRANSQTGRCVDEKSETSNGRTIPHPHHVRCLDARCFGVADYDVDRHDGHAVFRAD